MLICGINASHAASAALVRNGRVTSALQEERPTREKNRPGYPTRAIARLLEAEKLDWRDVDAWVFGGLDSIPERDPSPTDRGDRIRAYKDNLEARGQAKRMIKETPLGDMFRRRHRRRQVQRLVDHGVERGRIHTVEHHACHAATAYYGNGLDSDALVVTLDGAGDSLCATVSRPGPRGGLERLTSVHERHSIGNLWEVITAVLGMVPNEHEYKLMGMAPYANGEGVAQVKDIFRGAFELHAGGWRRSIGVPNPRYSYDFWRQQLEFYRFDHICGGLQAFTEEFVAEWIQGWLQQTGCRRLRLSGGVFMNVKLNKILGELPEVDDLYTFPSCGDETNAIGAAWAHMAEQGLAHQIQPLQTLYLGPEPAALAYVAAAEHVRGLGWRVERPPDVEERVADLLARGEVVARMSGREEFGARSLGNRAILADPSRSDVVRLVNKAIKCRDFWMPFAPTVLAEAADDYIDNPKGFSAPYMILAFDSRNTGDVRAACHPEDGTIRPQVVTREQNPGYHRLLEHFQARTGRGAILNTSFNIHGEPIVSTPEDAVDVMRRSGLRHLALGPFLISKPDPVTA